MSEKRRKLRASEITGIWDEDGRAGFFFTATDGANRQHEYVVTVCESGVAELAEMFRRYTDWKKAEAQRAWNRAVTLDKRLKGEPE